MKMLYPMTFTPVLKDYVWGGRNLEKLGRELPPGVTAESWEIAGHEDGTTVVENGHYAGWPLTKVHAELGFDLVGRRSAWAQERDKPTDPQTLCADPDVEALIRTEIDALQADFAPFERVRSFRLLETPFSIEEGTLTPTLKAVRGAVAARYAAVIEELYAE